MIYFLLFLFELVLLLILSKKLINSLAGIVYRFTGNHKVVVHVLAIIFLPGTIIHELAHLLVAGVMLVPVGELSIVPQMDEKGVRLGSLEIAKTDPFRRAIVGFAPVLLGMVLIFAIFILVKIGVSPWWQILLGLYFLFQIGNTMFSSKKDLEGSILFVVLILVLSSVITAFLYFVFPYLLQNIWLYLQSLDFNFLISFFKQAALYLIIPLALDLLIILITALFKTK